MIIDQLCVFFDSVAVAASGASAGLPVNIYSGRFEPANIAVLVKGVNTTVVTFTIKAQESDDNNAYTDVASYTLTKNPGAASLAMLRLPSLTRKRYIRLSYTATAAGAGVVTGLTIFAGVTLDGFEPYESGQYIDAGKVVA